MTMKSALIKISHQLADWCTRLPNEDLGRRCRFSAPFATHDERNPIVADADAGVVGVVVVVDDRGLVRGHGGAQAAAALSEAME